jgi:hypothetical protein
MLTRPTKDQKELIEKTRAAIKAPKAEEAGYGRKAYL